MIRTIKRAKIAKEKKNLRDGLGRQRVIQKWVMLHIVYILSQPVEALGKGKEGPDGPSHHLENSSREQNTFFCSRILST